VKKVQRRFQPILKQHLGDAGSDSSQGCLQTASSSLIWLTRATKALTNSFPTISTRKPYNRRLKRAARSARRFRSAQIPGRSSADSQHRQDLRTLRRRRHAVVGAISLRPDEVERRRAIMREIVRSCQDSEGSDMNAVMKLPYLHLSFGCPRTFSFPQPVLVKALKRCPPFG